MAPDFLPPDSDAQPPRPAGPPVFVPPSADVPTLEPAKNDRAVVALAFGAAGLGLLVFTMGALFILTLPASIAGWVLGVQAQRREARRDHARVAVIIGITGTVLGVIAAVVWILVLGDDDGTRLGVLRLAGALR